MPNAIFTTKKLPSYDDIPEVGYHFPQTYYNQVARTVGDWIVYYESRRVSADLASRGGRSAYFATARVDRVVPDTSRAGHFYAFVSDFIEFTQPVPFCSGTFYPE